MNNLDSTVQVIANAVENDTASLRQLLKRNGVNAINTTKDELQKMLTSALMASATFRNEFRSWVLSRSGMGDSYSNATGDLGLGLGQGPSSTQADQPKTEAPKEKSSFWSGVTMNSLLDFAANGLNNYTEIVKSKTDKAIVDAAVEKERLNQTTGPAVQTQGTTPKWLAIGGVVLAIAVVGGAIYYMTKKK